MNLKLVVIIISKLYFIHGQCDNIPKVSVDKCCQNVTSLNLNYSNYARNVTLNVVDTKSGIAELKFNLFSGENKLDITLFYNEMDKKNCISKTINNSSFYDKHTTMYYYIVNDNAMCPPCKMVANIQFSYIFTGCYQLEVGSDKPLGFYLETKYKKSFPQLFINNSTRSTDDTIIQFRNIFSEINLQIKITDSRNDKSIMYQVYQTGKTNENSNEINVCKIKGNINITNPVCRIQTPLINKSMECIFVNLPNGLYEFIYIINEPVRCNPSNTIWKLNRGISRKQCAWKGDLKVNFTKIKNENSVKKFDSWLYIFIIFIIILIVLCISVIILSRKKSHRLKNEYRELKQQITYKPELLLIYAKDCQQFMDMIEALRNVLIIDGKFTVFDFYDKVHIADVSANFENWLSGKLTSCKIILILSICASIQKKYFNTHKSLYTVPSSEDNYFIHALNFLEKDLSNDQYNNLYVVYSSCDQTNYECFEHINSFTRYIIPEHLSQIMAELNNEQVDTETDRVLLEEACTLTTFLEKYRDYKEYCNINPNYFKDFITLPL